MLPCGRLLPDRRRPVRPASGPAGLPPTPAAYGHRVAHPIRLGADREGRSSARRPVCPALGALPRPCVVCASARVGDHPLSPQRRARRGVGGPQDRQGWLASTSGGGTFAGSACNSLGGPLSPSLSGGGRTGGSRLPTGPAGRWPIVPPEAVRAGSVCNSRWRSLRARPRRAVPHPGGSLSPTGPAGALAHTSAGGRSPGRRAGSSRGARRGQSAREGSGPRGGGRGVVRRGGQGRSPYLWRGLSSSGPVGGTGRRTGPRRRRRGAGALPRR